MANLYKIKDKTVLFIHIPKTGGRSLRKVLEKYEFKKYNLGGHPDYRQIKKIMGKDFKSIDYIFSIVRNPFDWRHSWYNYVKNTAPKFTGHKFEHEFLKSMTFIESIKWLGEECLNTAIDASRSNFTKSYYAGEANHLFIKPQIDYLTNENGELKIDKILKLDTIESNFKDLMNGLGLKLEFNVHINKSSNINYEKSYDKKSRGFIAKIYKEDIEKFNF